MMNILFFTEISPFPINGGERIRSYGLLKVLSRLNYNVTAFIQNIDNVDLNDYSITNVKYIEFCNTKPGIIDKILKSVFFKKDKKVKSLLESSMDEEKYNLAILDFYLAGRYISIFRKRGIPVVIGTHNSEANLAWQTPSYTIIQFFRKMQSSIFMYMHERYFYKKADALIAVSNKDLEYHSKFYNSSNIYIIPNFLDESRYKVNSSRENYFVMTANFGAYMNFEGLKWFVYEVWNAEINSNHKLLLVGKKSKESLAKLNAKYDNILALGTVEDITPYIAKAKAALIPLLQGSGSRLKCAEAMALKTPIISTSIGVEGVKSKNFYIADSSNEFRNQINSFEYTEDVGEKLYIDFMDQYSIKSNIPKVKELIENYG